MNPSKLTLVMPGLLPLMQTRDCPNLSLLLSRAKHYKNDQLKNYHALISHLFAYAGTVGELPVAAFELLASGVGDQHSWYCKATPCLMSPNREHLAIVKSQGFDINEAEARAFCDELNDYFQDLNLSFFYTQPDQWYCRAESPFSVPDCSADEILSQNIMPYMPASDCDKQWRHILNDIQMFLHHSKTNQQRINNGKPEINSLWFWGAGSLPAEFEKKFANVYSDDPLIRGIAELSGGDVNAIPSKNISEALDNISDGLIYYSDPAISSNKLSWLDKLNSLDDNLFAKLLANVKRNKLQELHLIFEPQREFVLSKSDLKKFWKSRKAIKDFIQAP